MKMQAKVRVTKVHHKEVTWQQCLPQMIKTVKIACLLLNSKTLQIFSVGDERQSISKTNGKDAVNVQVTKAQDANTVKVAKDTKKEIDEFTKDNKDIKATKVMDTAKPIEDSLYTMIEKAALGTI